MVMILLIFLAQTCLVENDALPNKKTMALHRRRINNTFPRRTNHSPAFKKELSVTISKNMKKVIINRRRVTYDQFIEEKPNNASTEKSARNKQVYMKRLMITGFIFVTCSCFGMIWMIVSHFKTKEVLKKQERTVDMHSFKRTTKHVAARKYRFSVIVLDNGKVVHSKTKK